MRTSHLVLVGLFAGLAALIATLIDARSTSRDNSSDIVLVQRLGLTDLALFSEARYTRHPSQADLHSAFQDHPAAFEHFPSGSFVKPARSSP